MKKLCTVCGCVLVLDDTFEANGLFCTECESGFVVDKYDCVLPISGLALVENIEYGKVDQYSEWT